MKAFETTAVADSGWIVRWLGDFPQPEWPHNFIRGNRPQIPALRFEKGQRIIVRSDTAQTLAALVQLDSDTKGMVTVLPFGPSHALSDELVAQSPLRIER